MQNSIHYERESICPTKGFWGQLNRLIIQHYKSVTIADLADKSIMLEDDNQ